MLPQDEIVVATTASAHLPAAAIETITELVQRAKLDPLPTAPAGLVSRESVPTLARALELAELNIKELNGCDCPGCSVHRERATYIADYLRTPAIGVSDAQVRIALDAFVSETARNVGKDKWEDCMRAALEAALRPTGEDHG